MSYCSYLMKEYFGVDERLKHKFRRIASMNDKPYVDIENAEYYDRAKKSAVLASSKSDRRYYSHDKKWFDEHPEAKPYFQNATLTPTKKTIQNNVLPNISRHSYDSSS